MEFAELQALISLLDDEDPQVEKHVRRKLLSLGLEVVPDLEAYWEYQADEFVQQRIEDLIHTIQSQETYTALRQWRVKGGGNLLTGWYWVTRFQYPSLELQPYADKINRMVNRIWLTFQPHFTLTEKLEIINRMLYEEEGFRSNRQQVFSPANYYLNGLLETRKGAPISLGMLTLVICDALEIPLQGINLPGYFVLTYQSEQQELYLDPFNRGSFFTREELVSFLKELEVEEAEKFFRPHSNIYILLHWIHTLKEAYRRRNKPEKVRALDQLLHYIDLDVDFP